MGQVIDIDGDAEYRRERMWLKEMLIRKELTEAGYRELLAEARGRFDERNTGREKTHAKA